MLVLARRIGESLTFVAGGEQFTVEVSRVSGDRVTLAIDAATDVQVVRTELLEPTCDLGEPVG